MPKSLRVSNRSRGHRHRLGVKFNQSRPETTGLFVLAIIGVLCSSFRYCKVSESMGQFLKGPRGNQWIVFGNAIVVETTAAV